MKYFYGFFTEDLKHVSADSKELCKSFANKIIHLIILLDFQANPTRVDRAFNETFLPLRSRYQYWFETEALASFIMIIHLDFWLVVFFDQFTGKVPQAKHHSERGLNRSDVALNR